MNENAAVRLMMERQGLIAPLKDDAYEELFRLFSPVHTRFWIRPGFPPAIQHRFAFDTEEYNRALRRDRTLVKGRFQSGRIGYVFSDELPLFIAAYGKPKPVMSFNDELVLRVLQDEGPMSIKMMAEICETTSKAVAESLKKLQQAFIVLEDQVDDEWDRAWYLLEDELGLDSMDAYTSEQAQAILIERFVRAHVFATPAMVREFTGFKAADISRLLKAGEAAGRYQSVHLFGQDGFVRTEDVEALEKPAETPPDTLFIMDNNDFLVRAHTGELKKTFPENPDRNLFYVLYRGRFIGAVQGRFTFSYDELNDVKLLDAFTSDEPIKRRVIEQLYTMYDKTTSPLLRYAGKPV